MLLQPFTLFSFNISAYGFVLVGLKNNNNNINKVDVLHVRLTELHAAHYNLPPSYSHPPSKGNHTKYTPKTTEI